MEYKLEIKNERKIINAFEQSPKIFIREVRNGIKKTGVFVQGEVKKTITAGTGMWKSPIDTGQMRQGIGVRHSGLSTIIEPSKITPYAVFVHEGTKFMRARPFFDITVKHKKKDIEKFLQKSLERAVNIIAGMTK